jgi:hypothetical protein
MAWAQFENHNDFNNWHIKIKASLGIPRDFTTEYTGAIEHPTDGRVVAYVDEQVDTSSMILLSDNELKQQGWNIFLDTLK